MQNEIKEEVKKPESEADKELSDLFVKDEEVAATENNADTLTAGQETDGTKEDTEVKTEEPSVDMSAEEKSGAENSVETENLSQKDTAQTDAPEVEKAIFTQSQVNKLAGKAREEGRASALKELFARYGVADENELNGIFGKGQTYDDLNEEYAAQGNSVREVRAENALLRTNIVPERWDDVKAILGTKGLEVSQENITAELATHPEWRGASVAVETEKKPFSPELGEQLKNTPTQKTDATESKMSPLRRLGTENGENESPEVSEEKKILSMFGL